MPGPEDNARHQKAVLWRQLGYDTDGRVLIDVPEEVDVRWVEGRNEARDEQGNSITYDATVKVSPSIEDVPVGSIMWQGHMHDITGTAEEPESDLFQVIRRRFTPDIKGRKTHKELLLQRYTDRLPDYA